MIPSSEITDKKVYLRRREFIRAAALTTAGAAAGTLGLDEAEAQSWPRVKIPGTIQNSGWGKGEKLNEYQDVATYNNFYEFGMSKSVAKPAQALKLRPWTVKLDGMVEKVQEIGIDDLVRKMPLEERLYRHRCVEAWSMAIPWSGFPFARLVELAKPLSSAKYVRMETFLDPSIAPGQKQTWYPWPYVEGLTIAEATNELAFLVTGAYGKPVSKVQGAPLRLAVPWKYGFKSIKSIVRFTFTDQRPKSYWEGLQAAEYGFWANVNPQVAHPRWSQASERVLGTDERVPTQVFNGYAAYVTDLCKGLEAEPLYR